MIGFLHLLAWFWHFHPGRAAGGWTFNPGRVAVGLARLRFGRGVL